MNHTDTPGYRPGAILLATDLSARCDRALDRAALLATEWRARLVVVHVLAEVEALRGAPPGAPGTDALGLVRRQLVHDVGRVAEKATLVIERGPVPEAIIRVARSEGCELIVLGIARDELLGRYALGTTVDRLLRGAPAPLLIVEARARDAYRRVVVASDFSESSREALQAALRLFPDQRLTVFHAFGPPPLENPADARDAARAEGMRFIAATPRPGSTPEPELIVAQGEPATLLRAHVREHGADLVVLGSHGRGAIYEIFLGSTAKRILDHLPCDALMVREPQAASQA